MTSTRRLTLLLAAAALFSAGPLPASGEAPAPLRYGSWGFDLDGADPATRPGDDFFRHANGGWLDRTSIPADRSWVGVDTIATETVEFRVRAILEGTGEEPDPRVQAEAVKIRDLYHSFMDEARIEQLGLDPVAPYLAEIRSASSHADLAEVIGKPGTFNRGPFSLQIYPDDKSPDRYAVYIGQSGLGLPERDYYLEPAFKQKKEAYLAYIAELLGLAGWPGPADAAAKVLALETSIAEASWSAVERRDSERAYHPTSLEELERAAPFPWRRWLRPSRLETRPRYIANENTALPKIAAIYMGGELETLKAWQTFTQIDGAAHLLPQRFVEAQFRFRSQALEGVDRLAPRWKRGATVVNNAMGEAVGRIYVARHFPDPVKRQVEDLVGRVKAALKLRLERNEWMSEGAKTKALDKLARLTVKVGYPRAWRDYSSLPIRRDAVVENVQKAMIFELERNVRRLDMAVDREEWTTTPQTVNAYYENNLNGMTLPAAQLQPPFFDPAADAAVNYGGIGAVIGHELIHGFDDDGRRFDGAGVLSAWWSEADIAAFLARAAELGRQYDSFEVFPGAFVNGELTMGENIADLGGVLVAFDAYRLSLGGRPAPVLDGLTGEQRFFLGFAQSWRAKTRENSQRRMLVTDPHAPEAARVNYTLRNVDAWYEAFAVRPGDKLYLAPERRVRLW